MSVAHQFPLDPYRQVTNFDVAINLNSFILEISNLLIQLAKLRQMMYTTALTSSMIFENKLAIVQN